MEVARGEEVAIGRARGIVVGVRLLIPKLEREFSPFKTLALDGGNFVGRAASHLWASAVARRPASFAT
jgi:hypothetical protein